MNKRTPWLALVLLLLALSACSGTSEGSVSVTNTGVLAIQVTISYNMTTLAPGASDTFTLSWPGGDSMSVTLIYYPVNQPQRSRYLDLELLNGDTIDLRIGFAD
jgi:hypothetical protein